MRRTIKKNIVRDVIEHFANPKNRHSVATQCILKQYIKPCGIVAKFDTFNAAASTIHADEDKVDKVLHISQNFNK